MPLIEVTLAQGRTPEQLRALMSKLTYAAVEAIGAPIDTVRVVLREVPATHWSAGDVTIAERNAAKAAATALDASAADGGSGSTAPRSGAPDQGAAPPP